MWKPLYVLIFRFADEIEECFTSVFFFVSACILVCLSVGTIDVSIFISIEYRIIHLYFPHNCKILDVENCLLH